jgi:hypothetical protein
MIWIGSAKTQMRIRNTGYSVILYNENCISCGVRYEDVPEPAKPLEIPILYLFVTNTNTFGLEQIFKGTVARDFWACFLTVCMHLGLNVNSFWF